MCKTRRDMRTKARQRQCGAKNMNTNLVEKHISNLTSAVLVTGRKLHVRVSMISLLSGRLEKYTASGVCESVCRNETVIWVLAVKIVIVEAGNTQPTILQQLIPRGRRTWCG